METTKSKIGKIEIDKTEIDKTEIGKTGADETGFVLVVSRRSRYIQLNDLPINCLVLVDYEQPRALATFVRKPLALAGRLADSLFLRGASDVWCHADKVEDHAWLCFGLLNVAEFSRVPARYFFAGTNLYPLALLDMRGGTPQMLDAESRFAEPAQPAVADIPTLGAVSVSIKFD